MAGGDARLLLSAVLGIGVAIALIVKGRFHPFLALLCGSFLIGLLAGLPPADIAHAVQKGAGDVLGGTGLVVALGLSLGAMLQLPNGAGSLAQAGLRLSGPRAAPWMSMAVALLIGLPLFFETGLVLLLPIVAAAAAKNDGGLKGKPRLGLMIPALAGLSTLHALVPPHPGPLLAVTALHADLGCTMLYGLMVGLPTAAIAGPLFGAWIARRVAPSAPVIGHVEPLVGAPKLGLSLVAVLLPLLLGRRMGDATVQGAIWAEAMKPAGAIILAIGAGSVFFSHVNDPGFWLVRSYLGTSTPDTFRTWSAMETIVSVVGLAFILAGSMVL